MGESFALMTVKGTTQPPSFQEAAKQLGVEEADLDSSFGVVPIDPEQGIYAVQVRPDKLAASTGHEPYRGPWSNPRIEPFGPVK
jgi:hypothetical protein